MADSTGIPLAPSATIRTTVGADPKDPKYKEARKKVGKVQTIFAMTSLVTDNEIDDVLSEVFNEMVNTHFDTIYDAVMKKRNQR